MKFLTVPLMLVTATTALAYEDFDDYDSGYRRPDPQVSSGYEPMVSPSRLNRYFGGNDPALVVPIQPGTGPSYISRDQVMTSEQYCYRSAVSGAMICQSH